MWILFWKKYTLSKFATFVSIIGALMRYAGVMCLVSMLIPAALICIAIGVGLHFCAEAIAKNKATKVGNAMNITKNVDHECTESKSVTLQQIPHTKCANSTSTTNIEPESEINKKIKCNNCGATVSATNKFCNECGNALIIEEPMQKECPKCGEMVDSKSRFCNNCGNEIK